MSNSIDTNLRPAFAPSEYVDESKAAPKIGATRYTNRYQRGQRIKEEGDDDSERFIRNDSNNTQWKQNNIVREGRNGGSENQSEEYNNREHRVDRGDDKIKRFPGGSTANRRGGGGYQRGNNNRRDFLWDGKDRRTEKEPDWDSLARRRGESNGNISGRDSVVGENDSARINGEKFQIKSNKFNIVNDEKLEGSPRNPLYKQQGGYTGQLPLANNNNVQRRGGGSAVETVSNNINLQSSDREIEKEGTLSWRRNKTLAGGLGSSNRRGNGKAMRGCYQQQQSSARQQQQYINEKQSGSHKFSSEYKSYSNNFSLNASLSSTSQVPHMNNNSFSYPQYYTPTQQKRLQGGYSINYNSSNVAGIYYQTNNSNYYYVNNSFPFYPSPPPPPDSPTLYAAISHHNAMNALDGGGNQVYTDNISRGSSAPISEGGSGGKNLAYSCQYEIPSQHNNNNRNTVSNSESQQDFTNVTNFFHNKHYSATSASYHNYGHTSGGCTQNFANNTASYGSEGVFTSSNYNTYDQQPVSVSNASVSCASSGRMNNSNLNKNVTPPAASSNLSAPKVSKTNFNSFPLPPPNEKNTSKIKNGTTSTSQVHSQEKDDDDGWEDDDGFGGDVSMIDITQIEERAKAVREATAAAIAAAAASKTAAAAASKSKTSVVESKKTQKDDQKHSDNNNNRSKGKKKKSRADSKNVRVSKGTRMAEEKRNEVTEVGSSASNNNTTLSTFADNVLSSSKVELAAEKQVDEIQCHKSDVSTSTSSVANATNCVSMNSDEYKVSDLCPPTCASSTTDESSSSSAVSANSISSTTSGAGGTTTLPVPPPGSSSATSFSPATNASPRPAVYRPIAGAWRPSSRGLTRKENIERQAKSLLNKLTIEKFPVIAEKLAVLEEDVLDKEELQGLVNLVMDKAVLEPEWSEMYADICQILNWRSGEFGNQIASNSSVTSKSLLPFARALVNKIQEEYQAMPRHLELSSEDKKNLDEHEQNIKILRMKNRTMGVVKLIGELIQRKMLGFRVAQEIVMDMVVNQEEPDEHFVECFCQLITTTGYFLDQNEVLKQVLNSWFGRLQDLYHKKRYSNRIKCVIQDVMDLRKCGWRKKIHKETAKALSELREQLESEEALGGAALAAQYGKVVVVGKRTNVATDGAYAEYLKLQEQRYNQRIAAATNHK